MSLFEKSSAKAFLHGGIPTILHINQRITLLGYHHARKFFAKLFFKKAEIASSRPPDKSQFKRYCKQYYSLFFLFILTCEIIMPANISAHPQYPSKVILSILNMTPPSALKHDSVDNTIAAMVGSERFCATTCKV